ncbi:MAG: LLM class flavin-dependent oxidoreductase [Dehalococcoidia bacterium]
MYIDEHSAVGVPVGERAGRMEEGLRLLRRLWTEEEVTNEGDYYPMHQVALEPKPVQPTVPLWVSSNWVQRGLRRVAELGDSWITNVPRVDTFKDCWQKVQENSEKIGRNPFDLNRCLYISVNLNSDADALREGDQFMQAYYSRPYEAVSKQLLCVFGPPQKCIDTIRAYQEAGINYFIVRFASPNQSQQLAAFTNEVLPAVR